MRNSELNIQNLHGLIASFLNFLADRTSYSYLIYMKIYTLSLIIDNDGNVLHSETDVKIMDKMEENKDDDAIQATTLEDMILMELNDVEGVARA